MSSGKKIQMNRRLIRLLVLLERGPKYGRQFAKIAPDMFFCNDEIDRNGNIGSKVAGVANIYSVLKRAQQAGLIEILTDFTPPEEEISDDQVSIRRKYYGITAQGQEYLSRTREMLNDTEKK